MFFKTSNGDIDWTGKDGWYTPVKSSEGFSNSNSKKSNILKMFIQAFILILVILLIYYLYRFYSKSQK